MQINRYPAQKETVDIVADGKVVVRSVREDENTWTISLPGAVSVLRHELPRMTYRSEFNSVNPLLLEGLAELIAKAAAYTPDAA